jgi:hypothetical protein
MTARARAFAAFGAYLCLATHLAGIVHVLVVRHATCPSHGEMVHGAAPVASHVVPVGEDVTAKGVLPEAEEEGDDHCLFVATRRRELAGLAPSTAMVVRAFGTAAVDTLPALAVVAPRPILRLAPKTSPPCAAV